MVIPVGQTGQQKQFPDSLTKENMMIMITNGALELSVTEAKQDNAVKAMAAEIILNGDAETVRNMDQHSFTLAARDKAYEMGYTGTHVGTVPTAVLELVSEYDTTKTEEEKSQYAHNIYMEALATRHAGIKGYNAIANTSDAVTIKTLLDALGQVGVSGNAVAIVQVFRERVETIQGVLANL